MKSLRKNFIYNTFYQILTIAIPIITTPYISRVLKPEGIGRYSFANSVAYYFVMITLLGVNNYGNRAVARTRDNKEELSKAFFSIFSMQLIVGSVSLLLYCVYLAFFCKDILIARIMMIYVLSSILDINWFYFGLEEFKFITIRNCLIKIVTVVLIFTFVKEESDLQAYCLIFALGMLSSQLALWFKLFKLVKLVKISIKDVIVHIKPNLLLFIPVIAVSLYKIMDKIMIGLLSTKIEVGLYESSDKIVTIPIALITSLGIVMLPRVSNLAHKGDLKDTKNYLEKSMVIAAILTSAISFGIMGVSKEFVPMFYGAGYDKCIILYQILLPSCLFIGFANVIRTQLLIPFERDKEYVVSVSCGAAVNLTINLLLIPILGAVGAAIGTLISESSVFFVQSMLSKRIMDISESYKKSIPFVFSGIIMFLTLININLSGFIPFVALALKIVLGAVIYIVLIIIIEIILKCKGSPRYLDFIHFLNR